MVFLQQVGWDPLLLLPLNNWLPWSLISRTLRNQEIKDMAIRAFLDVEDEGLGKTVAIGGNKGTIEVRVKLYIHICECSGFCLSISQREPILAVLRLQFEFA